MPDGMQNILNHVENLKTMSITKGKFKDGHTGWKVLVLEPNHSIGIQKGYSVIWSDDEEHVTDYVYEYDDAKLIAAAPTMLDIIQQVVSNDGDLESLSLANNFLIDHQLDNQK